MKGRKPKPTNLKLLQGNPGKRKINKTEPKPDGLPRVPEFLHPYAKAEWRRLARILHGLGLLSVIDRAVFSQYCQAWAMWRENTERVGQEGAFVVGAEGNMKPSCYLREMNRCWEQLKSILPEIGLTPSARSRIKMAEPEAKDPFEEFLKQQNG